VRAKIAGERPDWVLVFGDTNSTLAGALAASDEGVRIAHVESGMRSGDLSMPEEKNRIETDSLATLLFCPDERSRAILEAEGVSGETEVVGDVMADTALSFAPFARRQSAALERFGVELGAYLLVTVHREANVFQPRLGRIVEGINALSEPVVFPAHPRTRAALEREGLALGRHVVLSQPLGYIDFTALASQARVIVTDSGGLQKEAYWYGVPCVTLRPSTEWVDTIELGANVLVDDDPQLLVKAVTDASMPAERPVLYGDGNTAKRIADAISARA
jgi:UDP-N-acetylglucosamine 2-epimerase (non-hydrolysing)/UDP-GlcNAc3NAcA epimerase